MTTTKKIKKVETPIDQHETFVSLQKSFADSDISVEEKLKTLYDLQKADNEIEKLVQLRGELPSEVTALENEVAKMNARAEQYKALIAEYAASVEVNNANYDESEAEIIKYQQQLEGIQNSREFDSISKEIENHELLKKIAQKNIGELRAQSAEKAEALDDLYRRIEIREEDLRLKKEELENIVESTADQEKTLRDRREQCAKKIDSRTMSAYERIRASVHNHLAVVPVYNGDSCGGCFGAITPQRLVDIASSKKLIICEHCGRIIVSAEFE